MITDVLKRDIQNKYERPLVSSVLCGGTEKGTPPFEISFIFHLPCKERKFFSVPLLLKGGVIMKEIAMPTRLIVNVENGKRRRR
jgi:hypothetical protein